MWSNRRLKMLNWAIREKPSKWYHRRPGGPTLPPKARRQNFQTISGFWDLYRRELLDLDPPYQRRSVWNQAYKDAFVDTILMQYPAGSAGGARGMLAEQVTSILETILPGLRKKRRNNREFQCAGGCLSWEARLSALFVSMVSESQRQSGEPDSAEFVAHKNLLRLWACCRQSFVNQCLE